MIASRAACLAAVASAALAGAPAGATPAGVDSPGVVRVAFAGTFASLDPALSDATPLAQIEYATCAKLVTFPDASGARGTRLVPEVARTLPAVGRGDRTFTFRVRASFRFADGRTVTAQSFADAINRVLRPAVGSRAQRYFADILGARAVIAGRAATAAGIRVRGDQIQFTLTRSAPDFPSRLATQYACPVPPRYSPDAPSVTAPPGSGPYTITSFDPNSQLVLGLNPYYRGARPHLAAQIVWLLRTPVDAVHLVVERGDAEVGYASPDAYRELMAKYGVNRRRLFAAPSLRVAWLSLNTDRPLFRDNPQLRRAVNFAIDRHALVANLSGIAGRRTDQYLSPAMPGFHDADLYPLKGPNLRKAQRLARGHTRSGKVAFYTANASKSAVARAEIVRYDLAQIGLQVEIHVIGGMPDPAMRTPEAPYDIWDAPLAGVDYPDPYAALNLSFSGRALRPTNNTNLSYFDEPQWTSRLEAAARIEPPRRYDAYGQLDVALARSAAPAVAYAAANQVAFVGDHVGCVTLTPVYGLDLGAVCSR